MEIKCKECGNVAVCTVHGPDSIFVTVNSEEVKDAKKENESESGASSTEKPEDSSSPEEGSAEEVQGETVGDDNAEKEKEKEAD